MSIEIAGITYAQVHYDAQGDVLHLHRGDSATAVDFDATPEVTPSVSTNTETSSA